MQKILFLLTLMLMNIYFVTAANITQEEFNEAITESGYPNIPNEEVYRYFNEYTGNFTREESAMLLTQMLYESAAFKYTVEFDCRSFVAGSKNCWKQYANNPVGIPGKTYYGRGYLPLAGAPNYLGASQALGLDDQLLESPYRVANETKLAMQTSVWLWETKVRPILAEHNDWFGLTTKALFKFECVIESYKLQAQRRYNAYLKVASALKIYNTKPDGCYST